MDPRRELVTEDLKEKTITENLKADPITVEP